MRGWRRPEVRRFAWVLVLLVPLLLTGCATVPGSVTSQSSLSDLLLKLDASEKMGGDSKCRDRSVGATEVVGPVEQGPQGVSVRWTERWTVNRCGLRTPYLVKFARSPEGALDVTMQLEKPPGEPGTVAGKSIADPVLQRDTLGFLAQRDFWAATAEAAGAVPACRSRAVLDTEMVEPLVVTAVPEGRPSEGKWAERWTLDRCGTPVRYVVRFSATQKGTTFTAEKEP